MFNEKVLKDLEEFREKHFKKQCYMKNRKSDSYSIKIVATGIGDAISIKCRNCGKEKDVTDYDTW
jgi:hypothetical protein